MPLPTPHQPRSNGRHFPLIDTDFDRFELNTELEETLREAETANFYHDALDSEA
jgi:hypothetical protein